MEVEDRVLGEERGDLRREPARPGRLLDDHAAGVATRRLLPVVIVLPVFFGWLRLEGERAGLYDTATGTLLYEFRVTGKAGEQLNVETVPTPVLTDRNDVGRMVMPGLKPCPFDPRRSL